MHTTLQDNNDNVFLQASEIEAFFPHGKIITYTSEDIHVESRANGREVLVLQQGEDNKHVVRLYMITPQQDWRAKANYTWALSMGWMRDPNQEYENEDDAWLYWNKENNVESQIKASRGTELFSANSVSLHFEPMNRFPWAHKELLHKVSDTRIVLKDLLLGAHLEVESPEGRHRPCPSTVCDVVDGVVSTTESQSIMGISVPAIFYEGVSNNVLQLALAVPALVIFMGVIRFFQQRRAAQKYAPIGETDTQGIIGEEDEGQEMQIISRTS